MTLAQLDISTNRMAWNSGGNQNLKAVKLGGLMFRFLQADLASTNAPVRNAATHLAATCHKQLGAGMAAMLRNDIKPALMTALEEAFRANPQQQVAVLVKSPNSEFEFEFEHRGPKPLTTSRCFSCSFRQSR